MFNLEQAVEELKGITITLGEDEVTLDGITYIDFYKFICQLSDEEAAELVYQLEDKIGKEATGKVMEAILSIDEEIQDLMLENEHESSEQTQHQVDLPNETAPLPPVEMVDMNDFYSFSPDLITKYLDERSNDFAYIMGLFNSGYNGSQVFTTVETEKQRVHELQLLKLKHAQEMELTKLKLDYEVKIANIQLENSKVQTELATKQMSVKQLLG